MAASAAAEEEESKDHCVEDGENSLNVVREAVPALKEHLMILWRNEICLEVLIESGAGKTLTYFHNYCQFFSEEVPELRSFVEMSK